MDRVRSALARRAGRDASRGRSASPVLAGVEGAPGAPVVAALAYRGVSSRELDLPVTRLAGRIGAGIVFVGPTTGRLPAVDPSRTIVVDTAAGDAAIPDVLVVPGGLGWQQVIDDEGTHRWLARAAGGARGVLAMSTGSLLLAAVGHLNGRDAVGHWLADDQLRALGATVSDARSVADDGGRVVTASGAYAALDVVDALADHVRWSEWAPRA
ncbi:MAG: DJ-1/PfpI family protein [Ilumatobacter sp.]